MLFTCFVQCSPANTYMAAERDFGNSYLAPRLEARPYQVLYVVPASFLSSATGTTNPWRGAMVTTSSFRRSMFAFRFLVKFTARGARGGPFGAGGVKSSASTRTFSLGIYTIRMPSLWLSFST